MDALRFALRRQSFEIAPGRRFTDGELLNDLRYTQASLTLEQQKDLFLPFGCGNEIGHKQSQSLTNNHSTF